MPRSNLGSPTAIAEPFTLADYDGWISREIKRIENESIRKVVADVCRNLSDFIKFPSRAVLLWEGCDRITPEGKRQKYHRYPRAIVQLAAAKSYKLDSRPNGPAIASFLFADGIRPKRIGSANSWSIHHLYSGKYPYIGKTSTLHARKQGAHFTQSAGLVAAQPIADAMCDEFPFFSWLLRSQAFRKFGYDPDGVFSESQDGFGFAAGTSCEIVWSDI